ncbi:undecaprenyl-diphosphate phosphatase [soil metagenome]
MEIHIKPEISTVCLIMIDILQAIILGIVQGLTEWLPVSSSGHLALLQLAMGLEVPVFFDLVLHIGTLTGVFAIYKKDIISIMSSIYAFFGLYLFSKNRRVSKSSYNRTDITYTRLIILGMIPTAAIGIAFKSFFENSFHDTHAIAIGFITTGILVFMTRFLKSGDKKLGNTDAFWIGMGQGLSIFSSISRSGITLSIGMFRGLEKGSLVKYSFLLSIPAIIGASIFDLITADSETLAQMYEIPASSYIAGVLLSAVVGFASIKFLIRVINNQSFYLFSFYCVAIGLVTFLGF